MTSMQRWSVLVLAGLAMTTTGLFCWSNAQDAQPAPAATKPVTKWEIRFLPEPPGDFQKGWKQAEALADEGWELSGVERQANGPLIYFFKRPK